MFLEDNKENIIKDIKSLVKIPSVRDLSTSSQNAPFGKSIRQVFDKFIEISKREHFLVEDFDGYALHVEIGDGEEIIGVLGHLDIVPIYNESKWLSDPFELDERDGFIFGRGVNDDKGPVIGVLYALILLRNLGVKFKKRVRLILGGAEETTWECMEHYFKNNPQPSMAFSPDGNFPIVNGEKGILYYELIKNEQTKIDGKHNLIQVTTNKEDGFVCDYVKAVFKTDNKEELKKLLSRYTNIYYEENQVIVEYCGARALSRNPDRAENCSYLLTKDLNAIEELNSTGIIFKNIINKYFIDDIHGNKLGLYINDEEMGKSTLCIMNMEYKMDGFKINFDYRYPKGIDKEVILNTFNELKQSENVQLRIYKDLKLLYVDPKSKLIEALAISYENVFNEKPQLISKGAASYARVLDLAVAFGPTIEGDKPNSHESNENIKIETLFKAIEVYVNAIYNLACK